QTYHLPQFLVEQLTRITSGRASSDLLFRNGKGKALSYKVFDRPVNLTTKLPPECRAWFRLQVLAGVAPRGVHNLRRAAVTNLATADVTMEKITSVTGQ